MDYRKLDAGLVNALNDVGDPDEPALSVFVRVAIAPGAQEAAVLERLGIREVTEDRRVYTATLSVRGVTELSEQPWVQSLTLSRKLRPLGR